MRGRVVASDSVHETLRTQTGETVIKFFFTLIPLFCEYTVKFGIDPMASMRPGGTVVHAVE